MNVAGLVYILITLGLIATMLFTNHLTRKVTSNYFFWLGAASFCLIWVLAFRFIPDWQTYWEQHTSVYADPGSYRNSEIISRAFLLDACPCFFLMLCISLIADPSRRVARVIAPIALVGGLITIASIAANSSDAHLNAYFDAKWLFIGFGTERCYFIMHFMQILLSIGVLLNTPKSGWRVWITSVGSFAVYISYVEIVMAISHCAWFTTGLSPNDYINVAIDAEGHMGEYHVVRDITGAPANLCPLILILLLTSFGLFIGAVLKNYVFSKWIWQYGNVKSKNWIKFWDYNKFTKQVDKAWW